MASLPPLRTGVSIASTAYTAYLLLSSPAVRSTILPLFSPTAHPLRLLALLSAILLNLKSFPFVWHIRLFGALLYQLRLQPTSLPKDALFRPIVTTSMHSTLADCDYNAHKSNSTYFADLDIGRTQLITSILRKGILSASAKEDKKIGGKTAVTNGVTLADTSAQNDVTPSKGKYMMALGGVTCHFKREIKPYERFDIWTRVLTWDRKWIYLVSHVVKHGTVLPDHYDLQPWKKPSSRRSQISVAQDDAGNEEEKKRLQNAIFASSIAKYVVKKGRLTIAPEVVLQNSNLLPAKPEKAEEASSQDLESWTWDLVEKERLRGLELTEGFAALDGLHAEFPVSNGPTLRGEGSGLRVLGEYRDFLSW